MRTALKRRLQQVLPTRGNKPDTHRWFIEDDELICAGDKTYAVTKMWG
jgi:hypothetical protein